MKRKQSFSKRVSWKITNWTAIITLVMLLAIMLASDSLVAYESEKSTQHALDAALNEIELPMQAVQITAQVTGQLATQGRYNDQMLDSLVYHTVHDNSLVSGCGIAFVEGAHNGDKWYLPFARINSDSTIELSHLGGPNYNYHASDWMQTVTKSSSPTPCWTVPYEDGGQLVSTYLYPMFDTSGNLFAVTAIDVPVTWMEHYLTTIKPYPHAQAIIRCNDSLFIGLTNDTLIEKYQYLIEHSKNFKNIENNIKQGGDSMEKFSFKGNVSYIVYGQLSNKWALAIVCQYKEVFTMSSKIHRMLLIVGFFGIMLLYIICRRLVAQLTRPVSELTVSAMNMAKGNFHAQLPDIQSEDEMLKLRNSFQFMQVSLDDYIRELKSTTAANERFEGELSTARDIQMGMLRTDFPDNLYATLIPAKEVGGDLYDFTEVEGRRYIAIGDVSGKGVPASLLMAISRASLHFMTGLRQPMDVNMRHINNSIVEANSNNMFVTMFVARILPDTLMMEYCNAGHNPIIIIPTDGAPYYLKAKSNLAAGLFKDFPYEGEILQLAPGYRLILYTDGVTEAENEQHELFGEDRLLDWANSDLVRDIHTSDQDVVNNLLDQLKEFTQIQSDDITILSLTI